MSIKERRVSCDLFLPICLVFVILIVHFSSSKSILVFFGPSNHFWPFQPFLDISGQLGAIFGPELKLLQTYSKEEQNYSEVTLKMLRSFWVISGSLSGNFEPFGADLWPGTQNCCRLVM